jgi:hypothetical protein
MIALLERDRPRVARRGARRDALASRRSTVAILGPGLRSRVVVPGWRCPRPPGARGYEPPPRDATPRSAFGTSPETAPRMSTDANLLL